ncbi:MAG TPA: hypothetical protein VMF59_03680 [Bacteroidota bacterium]|nr:hypothetical protein [Bacteroidota bacterium]
MRQCACILMILLAAPHPLRSQEIVNSSYAASNGERVLRLESVVPISRGEAWKLFSTREGLRKWIAPVVAVDFRVGGVILTNYDSTKTTADAGTIRLPILSYIEGELLTLRVVLNDKFPASARREDQNLQEIIQLLDAPGGKTRIISSMIGWGKGPGWDSTYNFFARGNTWTYRELLRASR